MVATRSSRGLPNRSAMVAPGYTLSRRSRILRARAFLASADSAIRRALRAGSCARRRRPIAEEAAKAVEPLLDAGERRRVGKAEVALGIAAEIDAGRDPDVSALEDLVGEGQGVAGVSAGVGEHVERPRRQGADAEPHAPEPRHHRPPALVEG